MNSIVPDDDGDGRPADPIGAILKPKWRRIAGITFLSGLLGYGAAWLIPPTYTARMSFIAPQPQQNSAATALASLSALTGLSSLGGSTKNSADQYVSLMQSATLSNRIIERFKLMAVYDTTYQVDARKKLERNVRIVAGKKDGIITVDVDDHDPARAADMANAYVDELRKMSNGLALTEAQLRRQFFERHLEATRDKLSAAQQRLEASGFNAGALKAEPKAAAETYARLRAELASTQVRIEAMRPVLADQSPEMQRQRATLSGLQAQLAALEQPADRGGNQDYVGAYRDFKYQDTLFEIYARQFELAKLDESKEASLFQVVDAATRPEKRSAPKRTQIAAGVMVLVCLLTCFVLVRRARRAGASLPPAAR